MNNGLNLYSPGVANSNARISFFRFFLLGSHSGFAKNTITDQILMSVLPGAVFHSLGFLGVWLLEATTLVSFWSPLTAFLSGFNSNSFDTLQVFQELSTPVILRLTLYNVAVWAMAVLAGRRLRNWVEEKEFSNTSIFRIYHRLHYETRGKLGLFWVKEDDSVVVLVGVVHAISINQARDVDSYTVSLIGRCTQQEVDALPKIIQPDSSLAESDGNLNEVEPAGASVQKKGGLPKALIPSSQVIYCEFRVIATGGS